MLYITQLLINSDVYVNFLLIFRAQRIENICKIHNLKRNFSMEQSDVHSLSSLRIFRLFLTVWYPEDDETFRPHRQTFTKVFIIKIQ
jgi:hypothetical protein